MPKGLQTLEFSFEGDALTHFGGLFLIQRFCNQLHLRRRLQRILKSAPRWIDYRPEDLIITFLYVLIAGIQRVNKTEILQVQWIVSGVDRLAEISRSNDTPPFSSADSTSRHSGDGALA